MSCYISVLIENLNYFQKKTVKARLGNFNIISVIKYTFWTPSPEGELNIQSREYVWSSFFRHQLSWLKSMSIRIEPALHDILAVNAFSVVRIYFKGVLRLKFVKDFRISKDYSETPIKISISQYYNSWCTYLLIMHLVLYLYSIVIFDTNTFLYHHGYIESYSPLWWILQVVQKS